MIKAGGGVGRYFFRNGQGPVPELGFPPPRELPSVECISDEKKGLGDELAPPIYIYIYNGISLFDYIHSVPRVEI